MPRPDNSGSLGETIRKAKVSRRIQLWATRLLGLQSQTAKDVFLGANGQVTPQGERLLALLAQEARLNRHGFNADADRRLFDAGAQHMVRLLMDWIEVDGARVARAEQRLKDETTGKDR